MLYMKNERAEEVVELITEIRSIDEDGNKRVPAADTDVITVPMCPSCKTPGAFFKLYI